MAQAQEEQLAEELANMLTRMKLRAWSKRDGFELIDDLYWFEENGVHDFNGVGHHSKYEIMMFSGRKDLNGNDIYEGDVVHFSVYGEDYPIKFPFIILYDVLFESAVCEIVGNLYEPMVAIEHGA